jgi:hypothetical protein
MVFDESTILWLRDLVNEERSKLSITTSPDR